MNFAVRMWILVALASACFGQTLAGTVTAGDTGDPIAGASVSAVQQPASPGQRPAAYSGQTDANGNFTISVPAGQYRICVLGVAGYVDPCRWGNSLSVSAGASGLSVVLLKGGEFVLRIHDPGHLLQQAEAVPGTSATVFVAGGPLGPLALPKIYDDGRIRDFGDLLPLNVPLTVSISSLSAIIGDQTGAALPAGGVPFQITPADFTLPTALPGAFFEPPRAKIIHVYATGTK